MSRDDVEGIKTEHASRRNDAGGLNSSASVGEARRLRELIESTPCLVCFLDERGRILEANRAYLDAFGLTAEKCLGKSHLELARQAGPGAELFNRAHRWDERARMGTDPVMCEEIVSERGRDHIFELIRTPVLNPDGSLLGVSLIGQDITDRVKREFDSHILVAEQTAIFENVFVGIAFTRDGRVAKVNATLETMTGFSAADFEKGGLDVLLPGAFDALLEEAMGDLVSGRAFVVEREIARKDGSTMFARLGGKAVLGAGAMRGVVWLVEDVSEHKRVERLREDTERVVRHDLKSPLNAIIGCADILSQEVVDRDLSRMANMILNSGYKMLRMIDHSMDLFKMEEGRYALNPKPVDLVAMFRDLESEFAPLTRVQKIGIRYLLDNAPLEPESRLEVMGESRHLESLFANLVKNALEASPPGSAVAIRMSREGPTATIEVHNQEELPEDMRDRLFTRYATSGKSKGTGLGAYSARLIARTHGGDVRLAASGPEGTTIAVTLPMAGDAVRA